MADSQPAAPPQSQDATAQGATTAQLAIEKIYVKDLSLENPGAPQSFQMSEAPQIEIGLRTRGEPEAFRRLRDTRIAAGRADAAEHRQDSVPVPLRIFQAFQHQGHRAVRGQVRPAASAVGKHGISYTIVNLETLGGQMLETFEQAVRDCPEILDCYYIAGANDYLIRFAYRDAEDLERFHAEVLMRLPGVARSNSMLVLRTVKRTTALPL